MGNRTKSKAAGSGLLIALGGALCMTTLAVVAPVPRGAAIDQPIAAPDVPDEGPAARGPKRFPVVVPEPEPEPQPEGQSPSAGSQPAEPPPEEPDAASPPSEDLTPIDQLERPVDGGSDAA